MLKKCTSGRIFDVVLFYIVLISGDIPFILGTALSIREELVTKHEIFNGDVFFEIIEPLELQYTYRMRPAKDFGRLFKQRLEGVALVPVMPSDACTKIKNENDLRGNVALIERGECSFLTKTINVENAGACAAIITEFSPRSVELNLYIEMTHDNTDRDANIPAGFLQGRNGIVIRSTLQKQKRTHAIINIPVNLTYVPLNRINQPPWII